jgi:hypothetical protein
MAWRPLYPDRQTCVRKVSAAANAAADAGVILLYRISEYVEMAEKQAVLA